MQGTELEGGTWGERAGHLVGALPPLSPFLLLWCVSVQGPPCPGHLQWCDREGPPQTSLLWLRCVLCPTGLVAGLGGAGLRAVSSRFSGPYHGAVEGRGPWITVEGLHGQPPQFLLRLLPLLLPQLQVENLEESGVSGSTDSSVRPPVLSPWDT